MAITYNLTTNFLDKDSLPENDPAKVVRGSEFQTEFLAIKAAFSSAAPTASPSFTGTAVFNAATMTDLAVTNPIVGSITGNVTGDITGDVTGNLTGDVTGDVTGNVTGNLTGTVLTASQPNITSVGTLSSLDVSGDLVVNTDTLFVDSSSGRVGIGKSTPNAPLEVASDSGGGTLNLSASTAAGNFGTLSLRQEDGTTVNGAIVWNNIKVDLRSGGSAALSFTTNAVERMRIDSNGNVGIGEASPTEKLHVDGGNLFVQAAGSQIIATGATGSATNPHYTFGGQTETTGMFLPASNQLAFTTSGTERMRIDSSGNLLVGSTSQIVGTADGAEINSVGLIRHRPAIGASASEGYTMWNNGGTKVVAHRGNGGIANFQTNDVNLSDPRSKKDVVEAGKYLEKLCSIPVVNYRYKNQEEDSKHNLGVLTTDVEAVAPELVDKASWEFDGEMMDSLFEGDMKYAMLKAIQEQQAIIEELRARVAQLESGV